MSSLTQLKGMEIMNQATIDTQTTLEEIERFMNPARKKMLWMMKKEKVTHFKQIAHLCRIRKERALLAIERFLEFGLIQPYGEQAQYYVLTLKGTQYVHTLEQRLNN